MAAINPRVKEYLHVSASQFADMSEAKSESLKGVNQRAFLVADAKARGPADPCLATAMAEGEEFPFD